MKYSSSLRHCAVALLSLSLATPALAASNSSVKLLSNSFTPAPVFENTELVRNINLEKSYPRETTNIVIRNIGKEAQSEYYFLFPTAEIHNVGTFEARSKVSADTAKHPFKVELAQYETPSANSYFILHLNEPLKPSEKITIGVSYALLSAVHPLPALIEQVAAQTIVYPFSAHLPSAYKSQKQKTKLKLPTSSPAEFTKLEEKNAEGKKDPVHQGSSLTYGPYNAVEPFSTKPVSVRYEFTKPLLVATKFERDIEVSHWGGNLAVEERYWLTNRGAKLKNHFSRVQWQMSKYANPASVSAGSLTLPLLGGAENPYYTDDIGNVSTSNFRPGRRESLLNIRPRYPIYGGWNYSFKVGWDHSLKGFLRKAGGEKHVLKVPFMEGPRTDAGIAYEQVTVRVVLPEGSENIKFEAGVPLTSSFIQTHRTFMDTTGRPTLVLTARNAIEEWRERPHVVITYDYPWTAAYRKPIVITAAVFSVFALTWVIGNLDVRIGKRKQA
ncbi:Ribophorin I [Microthyrium microscopicum]|uniref:Dolichyl-diphosphooligosaccharide--protein glycosyltransferase subunit 1 n=1 Tax=Microthyrium microscopicum TaxID=703497 RepID=A0A6A6UH53_9PEZI|nr:Ribophorin I [Microthyrium microscopicum]